MVTTGYGTIFVLFIASMVFALSLLLIAWIVNPKAPNPIKSMPYESGMNPYGDARIRFDAKFYLYSLLFLLFDIEAMFLIPWAMGLTNMGYFGLLEMFIFITILFIGLVYAWRRKALEWL